MCLSKTCNCCKTNKPLKEYYKVGNSIKAVYSLCKECKKAKSKKYYEENRLHVIDRVKRNQDQEKLDILMGRKKFRALI